ncbi:uncharacterized protein LOC135251865 isoform X2 [Anguilla rostrata]|uniref:uncharacterized protein LOC135251865 isoform X2 n=1 Tax=Anguilla rostrata TaxID=7938 RepID=UPI0030CC77B5
MGYAPPPAGILRAQCCTYYICLSVSVADQLRDNFSPVLYLLPSTLHRMLRSTLLILAVAGLHAMPLPPREDTFSPLQVGAPVPEEFRRQGTQPSRPHLVDLRTGLLQDQRSEMERRVSHEYYVPYPVDQFRQGTQNSRAVLVDVRSGLPILPVGEMQRTMGKVYVPPSLDEFRQGTQNSRAILVDPRTGLIRDPIGEMSRNSVWTGVCMRGGGALRTAACRDPSSALTPSLPEDDGHAFKTETARCVLSAYLRLPLKQSNMSWTINSVKSYKMSFWLSLQQTWQ